MRAQALQGLTHFVPKEKALRQHLVNVLEHKRGNTAVRNIFG